MIITPVFTAQPVAYEEITNLRDLYRQEMNCQIIHDSHHRRDFTALYRLHRDGRTVGYGAVGDYDTQKAQVVKEFYLNPSFRSDAVLLFQVLLAVSGASEIEVQTNDLLLTLMLYDFCDLESLRSERILFADAVCTNLPAPSGATFRAIREDEKAAFDPNRVPQGDWAVEWKGEIVATGGFLCHYNLPYGDVYMEVAESHRNRGFGSYLVQEIKRVCYESGKRPAARCRATNTASRRTLQKAGFLPCARILRGTIRVEDGETSHIE